MVTLKFDLGYNYTKAINNDLYYKVTTDDDGKVWDQSWAGDWYVGDEDDYDCSETETYWNINVKEIPGRSTGTIYTRGIKFCKDSEGNSDVLEFAINFVQGNSDSAKRDEIYNNYVEMLSE